MAGEQAPPKLWQKPRTNGVHRLEHHPRRERRQTVDGASGDGIDGGNTPRENHRRIRLAGEPRKCRARNGGRLFAKLQPHRQGGRSRLGQNLRDNVNSIVQSEQPGDGGGDFV